MCRKESFVGRQERDSRRNRQEGARNTSMVHKRRARSGWRGDSADGTSTFCTILTSTRFRSSRLSTSSDLNPNGVTIRRVVHDVDETDEESEGSAEETDEESEGSAEETDEESEGSAEETDEESEGSAEETDCTFRDTMARPISCASTSVSWNYREWFEDRRSSNLIVPSTRSCVDEETMTEDSWRPSRRESNKGLSVTNMEVWMEG
ncbi:hypothetical protein BLNAU_2976 [Blattamonas nauphoetae]|nr:hypothetical protein BLNAU_2976 [Blattamonas nauphoetae]